MLALELGDPGRAGVALQPLDHILGGGTADFLLGLMDHRQGRAHHGADLHTVKAENIQGFGNVQTPFPHSGHKTDGEVIVGGKHSGGGIRLIQQKIQRLVTGAEIVGTADHQIVIIENVVVR